MMSIDSTLPSMMSIDSILPSMMSIDTPMNSPLGSSVDSSESFRESAELLSKIGQELQRRMWNIGMELPPETNLNYFITYNLLGEEDPGALNSSFLVDVLADLQLPNGIVSWYWEEAFKSVLLLHGIIL